MEIGISVLSSPEQTSEEVPEARLIALVLDTVTSLHSRRSYRTGLARFFAWVQSSGEAPAFTKALVGRYRTHLLEADLSAASINLRLSPVRRLAREMADNQMLDPAVAAAIERVPGVERRGTRVGNWLTREQANELLNAPDPAMLIGKRDRAILALLVVCGLRRAEVVNLDLGDLQQRDARWAIPDLLGKGGRARTVTVPAGVKARIDQWTRAAALTEGRLFRPVAKAVIGREAPSATKRPSGAWSFATRARSTSGNSRPTICGGLVRSSAGRRAAIWSRSSCCSATLPSRPRSAISGPSRT